MYSFGEKCEYNLSTAQKWNAQESHEGEHPDVPEKKGQLLWCVKNCKLPSMAL